MFTKKHYINIFSSAFLFLLNIQFAAKYSEIFPFRDFAAVILYLILFTGMIFLFDRTIRINEGAGNKKYFYFTGIIFLLLFISFFQANGSSDKNYLAAVDWLSNFRKGFFPYRNPSLEYNFPFIYYLQAPFYLLGSLKYFEAFGMLVFLFMLLSYSKTKKEVWIKILIVLLSPALYYEITNMNGLFINFVLVITALFLMNDYLNPERKDIKFFTLALLFGALLAAHILFVVPFCFSLIYYFRYNFKSLVLFTFISAAVCAGLIFPFVKWDHSMFNAFGPFNNHLLNFHWWIYLILTTLILYIGWMISDFQELLFASGVVLFLITFIIFLTDKNYLTGTITCIPFLILSIKESEIDKFLGKKIPL